MLTSNVTDRNVSEMCAEYGGHPVWFANGQEFDWLRNVLLHYAVDCFHMGKSTVRAGGHHSSSVSRCCFTVVPVFVCVCALSSTAVVYMCYCAFESFTQA